MITRLTVYNAEVLSHMVILLVVTCLRPLPHGATSPLLTKQHPKTLKIRKNLLLMPLYKVIQEAHLTPYYFVSMHTILLDMSCKERNIYLLLNYICFKLIKSRIVVIYFLQERSCLKSVNHNMKILNLEQHPLIGSGMLSVILVLPVYVILRA